VTSQTQQNGITGTPAKVGN